MVLTREVEEYLGPRLGSVIEAMTLNQEWKPLAGRFHPAQEVVRIVRRMDGSTSKMNKSELRGGGGVPGRGLPPPAPRKPETAIPEQQTLPFPPPVEPPKGVVATPPRAVPTPLTLVTDDPEVPPEEPPLVIPTDFWGEEVPRRRTRRGDPLETERRIEAELAPARFIDTLRRMVVARRLSRNNSYTEVYIRPDFVWLMLPRALRHVAIIIHLPFDTDVLRRMLSSLKASPQVVPGSRSRVPVFMKPRPDASTFEAVRLKTRGFLTEPELSSLGVYEYDLRAIELHPVSGPVE
jgi:hypothetical protein